MAERRNHRIAPGITGDLEIAFEQLWTDGSVFRLPAPALEDLQSLAGWLQLRNAETPGEGPSAHASPSLRENAVSIATAALCERRTY